VRSPSASSTPAPAAAGDATLQRCRYGCLRNAPAAGRPRIFFADGFIGDEVMNELLAKLRFLGAGDATSGCGRWPSSAMPSAGPGQFARRGRGCVARQPPAPETRANSTGWRAPAALAALRLLRLLAFAPAGSSRSVGLNLVIARKGFKIRTVLSGTLLP